MFKDFIFAQKKRFLGYSIKQYSRSPTRGRPDLVDLVMLNIVKQATGEGVFPMRNPAICKRHIALLVWLGEIVGDNEEHSANKIRSAENSEEKKAGRKSLFTTLGAAIAVTLAGTGSKRSDRSRNSIADIDAMVEFELANESRHHHSAGLSTES